jgi:hypothetical protein
VHQEGFLKDIFLDVRHLQLFKALEKFFNDDYSLFKDYCKNYFDILDSNFKLPYMSDEQRRA